MAEPSPAAGAARRADSGGAPKRWFVATPAEVDEGYARLPPQDRHVYEVIDARRPCWAYFDLEFTRKDGLNAAVDGDALTERVISAACDALVAAAGDRPLATARGQPPAGNRPRASDRRRPTAGDRPLATDRRRPTARPPDSPRPSLQGDSGMVEILEWWEILEW